MAVLRMGFAALAVLAAVAAGTATASATLPPGVATFVRNRHLARYHVALADLNGDGRPEALVYAMATAGGGTADLCGSGGCTLYVLSLTPTGYRTVSGTTITNPPIRVLPTKSHGWHDIGVTVRGGGILSPYVARLRYNGRTYPRNPSVPPATRMADAGGRIVIADDRR